MALSIFNALEDQPRKKGRRSVDHSMLAGEYESFCESTHPLNTLSSFNLAVERARDAFIFANSRSARLSSSIPTPQPPSRPRWNPRQPSIYPDPESISLRSYLRRFRPVYPLERRDRSRFVLPLSSLTSLFLLLFASSSHSFFTAPYLLYSEPPSRLLYR